MHPDLVKLLDLQEKDLALVEVDTRLAGILAETAQLDKELAEAERSLENRRRSAAEALRKRQESETKIENFRRLLERQQARTDQLRGQREIQAAMTEMDLARSVLAKEENDWAQAGDNVIAQDAATLAAEKKLEEQRASQAEAREALGQRMSGVQAERDSAKAARDASAAEVERACASATSGFAQRGSRGWSFPSSEPPAVPASPPCRSIGAARFAPAT
jgi:chromosome segregation ATPase